MQSIVRTTRLVLVAALIAVVLTIVPGAAPASADANATTDDSSVAKLASSWVYTNVSTATVGNLLSTNGARLTDIEPYSTSANTWTVTMVKNTGSYAVSGWWWYVDISASQVSSLLSSNNGRLIDIEVYDDGGTIKYAVVMVSNTGTTARGWTYLIGATPTQISNNISTNNQRLIDLESYSVRGVTYWAAVFVTNSGTDAKAWEWWYGQTSLQVSQRVASFGGRIVDIDRQPDGKFAFVQVKNTGADNFAWRHYYGLDITNVVNVLTQYGMRLVDIDVVKSGTGTFYDIVAIDNSTAESRRLNDIVSGPLTGSNGLPRAEWGYYLKALGGSTVTNLQASTKFEPASAIKAVHNLSVMRKVKAGQDSLTATNFVYYVYGSSSDGNDCPDPAKETAANRRTIKVDTGRQWMMGSSDNRTTRGVTLRYGLPYVKSSAAAAGMTSTTMDQDLIGCGYKNSKRNQTTLVDLGKLYEGVQNGALLGTGSHRSNFFNGMNGQNFNTGNPLEVRVMNIVKAEAQSLGKSTAVANSFISQMRWYFKPGGYGINCAQPLTPCTSGFESIGTIAGIVNLPVKSGGTTVPKYYVFGTYIEGLNTDCSGCPAYPEAAEEQLRAELLRPAIRAALLTH